MGNKETKQRSLTVILLVVYLLLLTWIILFKMQFFILDHYRSVNLIPFHGSTIVNGRIEWSEIYQNVLVFVPFGLYISMLKRKWPFLKKVAPITGVSFFFELMQYLLAIGSSDITDLIGNTLGGIVGIAIYALLRRLFRNDGKTNKVLNGIALFGTICAVSLLALVTVGNI